jgi:L-asparaginase II
MPEAKTLVKGEATALRCPAPLVQLLRGEQVESIHSGHVAVVNVQGNLLAWAGDPHAVVFPRSAFKPYQALPLVESGAFARSGLGGSALALIAGSHGGTDAQVAVVREILEAAGADETLLRCGAHDPYDRPTALALRERGEKPTPLRHNCSGKHAGMLLLARSMGAPLEGYTDIAHPVQRAIFSRFGELFGAESGEVPGTIDGCSAPTPRLKLSMLAWAFALLARGTDREGRSLPALGEIREAMMEYPENVAGEGRLDTQLMRALHGAVVSKAGAEGIHATGYLERGLGIAVKIADGDAGRRAIKPAVVGVLNRLALLGPADAETLLPEEDRVVLSHAGLPAGTIRPAVELERLGR